MSKRCQWKSDYSKVNGCISFTYLHVFAGGSGGDSAVQQAQVSSSKPAILADDVLGPLLLEVSIH